MYSHTRRRFLKNSIIGLGTAKMLFPARSRAADAAERVRIGVIGCGNQGKAHFRSLTTLKDAQIVYVCDVDEERLDLGVEMSGGAKPVGDFRRILDDTSIDGVTIATPDIGIRRLLSWH